ncbi:MAG: hypothetical protein JST59_06155, partial [Actinobacteria bacterium]|nr:hypothetical protein [Actinomycetota bacterium]
ETPACSGQLEAAGPFPLEELKKLKGEITGAIKKAHADIYVGEDDHIVRRVTADLTVEPPSSDEKAEIEFDFSLGGVNEQQTIKAPANAEPLEKLFGQLGVNPLELLGMMQGGGTEDIGSLLEGITGSESGEGIEIPPTGNSKAFNECLKEVKSASDVQECASLME